MVVIAIAPSETVGRTGEPQTGKFLGGEQIKPVYQKTKIVMEMKESIFVNRLNKIRFYNRTNPQFVTKDLYKLLVKEESLRRGYEKIKNNRKDTGLAPSGQGLKGGFLGQGRRSSLDGSVASRIRQLSLSLQNESWKPLPLRRIEVSKPGKVEKRPLRAQEGLEEKVVQAVVSSFLESIYEPTFSPNSYGNRPGKGVHDLLKVIDQNYDEVVWALEGEIKGKDEGSARHLKIKLLEKKISDDRFIRLIWKLLRAGYLDGEKKIKEREPFFQPSTPSLILTDIYLHELDRLVEDFRQKKRGVRSADIRTPPFNLLERQKGQASKDLKVQRPGEDRKLAVKRPFLLKNKSLAVRRDIRGSDRIIYTRYAERFIVGVAGSKALVLEIEKYISGTLQTLGLALNEEKSKITFLRKENAFFCGHRIKINLSVKGRGERVKKRTPFTRKVTGKFVTLTAPMEIIVSRLSEKGFCDPRGNPKGKKSWISQKDPQIVYLFNSSIKALFGFYSGVHKKHALTRILYIFKFSCAMTLAARHRCSLAKIFEKHGSGLKVNYGERGEKSVALYKPDLKKACRVWQSGKSLPDPFR